MFRGNCSGCGESVNLRTHRCGESDKLRNERDRAQQARRISPAVKKQAEKLFRASPSMRALEDALTVAEKRGEHEALLDWRNSRTESTDD